MEYNSRTTPTDIIDKIVSIEGLYQKVFWPLLYKLVNDRGIANDIHLLKHVYGMKDADIIFEIPIDRGEFSDLTKIIFKYQENQKPNIIWGN